MTSRQDGCVTYPERRSVRLLAGVYSEPGRAFSVTISTAPRRPVFLDVEFGRSCVELLAAIRQERNVPVYGYCLMPDHVHLVIGVTRSAPLSSIVGAWKSLCAREWRDKCRARSFWQRGFYESIIRQEEDLFRAATYVLENPVRAGLVADFHDYELCGSMEYEL